MKALRAPDDDSRYIVLNRGWVSTRTRLPFVRVNRTLGISKRWQSKVDFSNSVPLRNTLFCFEKTFATFDEPRDLDFEFSPDFSFMLDIYREYILLERSIIRAPHRRVGVC